MRHNCSHSADAGVGCEGNIFCTIKYLAKEDMNVIPLQFHAQLVNCG